MTTRKQAIERLTKLHDLLLNLKEELPQLNAFDMDRFINTEVTAEDIDWYDVVVLKPLKESECGTAACALGSAALHSWFRRRGLRPSNKSYGAIDFAGYADFVAGAAFFGITHAQSIWLFEPWSYGTRPVIKPRHVATRVANILKDTFGVDLRKRAAA